MPRALLPIALVVLAAGCADGPLTCGEGRAPVVVSGLNGVLEPGGQPAVEMQARVPETCAVLDTRSILLDEVDNTLRVVEEPDAERVDRSTVLPVPGTDNAFTFGMRDVTVSLVYADGVGPAAEVEVVWTAVEEIGRVTCRAEDEGLTCAPAAP